MSLGKIFRAFGLFILAGLYSSINHAAIVTIQASFTATGFVDTFSGNTPPVDTVSGSFVISYDPSTIATTGYPVQNLDTSYEVPVDAVNITIGDYQYDPSNSAARLDFDRQTNQLVAFMVGGDWDGFWSGFDDSSSMSGNTDDMLVLFSTNNNNPQFIYTVSSIGSGFFSTSIDSSYTVTTVPLPAPLGLLMLGFLTLSVFRKRK